MEKHNNRTKKTTQECYSPTGLWTSNFLLWEILGLWLMKGFFIATILWKNTPSHTSLSLSFKLSKTIYIVMELFSASYQILHSFSFYFLLCYYFHDLSCLSSSTLLILSHSSPVMHSLSLVSTSMLSCLGRMEPRYLSSFTSCINCSLNYIIHCFWHSIHYKIWKINYFTLFFQKPLTLYSWWHLTFSFLLSQIRSTELFYQFWQIMFTIPAKLHHLQT